MTGTPQTASVNEFARMLGVRPSAITALRNAGRLVFTDDGKRILVDESRTLIRETMDPSKAGVVARHAAARAARNAAQGATGADAQPSAQDAPEAQPAPPHAALAPESTAVRAASGYQASRAVREKFLALAAKRDYEISIGKLLDAAEVTAAATTAVATLRGRLEVLSDVLAARLAAVRDESAARAILTEEIEHALEDLARQFQAVGRGNQP